jgi:heat-inducible transcriptional repressor
MGGNAMMKQYLPDRQSYILRFLVEEYVDTGRAVGSQTLIDRYPLNVSSATVRNEMATLERMGYIQHPHTSSGRVPTDLGYRYYVEHFAQSSTLPQNDQIMIRHQFRQVESQLESWLQLTASVLAEIAGNVSMVTSPHTALARLRHFELLSLQDRVALLILVTQESSINQAMIHFSASVSQSELSSAADRLNEQFRDLTVPEVARTVLTLTGIDQAIGKQVAQTLAAAESGERSAVHHQGIEYLVQQPEFSNSEELRPLLDLLRGGSILSALLPQLAENSDVQIFIGNENVADELRGFGIVVASYGVGNQVTGLVGILGPRRMQYERSISSVRYMSQLVSDLMRDLYYRA